MSGRQYLLGNPNHHAHERPSERPLGLQEGPPRGLATLASGLFWAQHSPIHWILGGGTGGNV